MVNIARRVRNSCVRVGHWLPIFAVVIATVSLITSMASAASEPQSGWQNDSAEAGVTISGNAIRYSAPTLAEIDGNTSNGSEVVVGSSNGIISVLSASGTELWSKALPSNACSGSTTNRLFSSPAVGALFGDGVPYVVAGYGGIGNRGCDGGIIALRGSDGSVAWNFSLKAFAKKEKFWAFLTSTVSSPALADVDNDGKLEIGFGAFDRNVYLLNHDGTVRWYYTAADTVWSSPAFADINNDGKLELIIGTDISANKKLRPPTKDGGYVYAFKTAPRKNKKIGFRDSSAYYWQTAFDQVIYAAPIVADVLASNPGNEVIVASGCYFPERKENKRGKWIKVMSARSGKVLKTLTVDACSTSSPAVADIDNDGSLELLATISGSTSIGGAGVGKVFAWDEGVERWNATPRVRGNNADALGFFASPVIADLDGNGSLEIAVANEKGVAVLAAESGQQLSCTNQGEPAECIEFVTSNTVLATPAIGDLNNDGILELVAASANSSGSTGKVYAWTGLGGLMSVAGGGAPYAVPWPLYRGDPQHRGATR